MPYKNIVFAKLEKRLFHDHRWYMMSEKAQLNYIRFILFAAETYNKIPKNLDAIRRAFKTDQDLADIKSTIKEIKNNFPKFKENKHFYYFDGFDEKTNYIPERANLGKSQVSPKEGTDKEEDKEEDKDKDIYNIVSHWNAFANKHNLPAVKKLTDKRRRHIRQRVKDRDFDFLEILNHILKSDFLLGKSSEWKVSFDFIFCSRDNYIKILEGKYDGRQKQIQRGELDTNKYERELATEKTDS